MVEAFEILRENAPHQLKDGIGPSFADSWTNRLLGNSTPNRDKIDDDLLDYYRDLLEVLLKKDGCKDFINDYVSSENLLNVFDSVRAKSGYYWGDFSYAGQADPNGSEIELTKNRKWTGISAKREFENTVFNVNTLLHELIHASSPERIDSFMAKLLHDNGEKTVFPYHGPSEYNVKTIAGRAASEGWSSMWWGEILSDHCRLSEDDLRKFNSGGDK